MGKRRVERLMENGKGIILSFAEILIRIADSGRSN